MSASSNLSHSPTALLGLVRQLLEGKKIGPPIPGRPALSGREMQILSLIGRGMERREIASELGISEKTVGTYLSRLLHKLELRNVVELVRYAVEAESKGETGKKTRWTRTSIQSQAVTKSSRQIILSMSAFPSENRLVGGHGPLDCRM